MALCESCGKNEGERFAVFGQKQRVTSRELIDGKDKKKTETVYDGPFYSYICADCLKKRNRSSALFMAALAILCGVAAIFLRDMWRIIAIVCAAFALFMLARQLIDGASKKRDTAQLMGESIAKSWAAEQHPGYEKYLSAREYEMEVGALPE